MNVGININSSVSQVLPNKLIKSNQASSLGKGAFIKMMAALMNESQNKQGTVATEESVNSFNVLELLTKGNMGNLIDLSSSNFSNIDEINIEADLNNEEKLKSNNDNTIYMMSYMNPIIEKDFEKQPMENMKNFAADNILNMNYNQGQNIKHAPINIGSEKENAQEFKLTERLSDLAFQDVLSELETKESKQKLNGEINFNSEVLSPNKPLIEGENTIITVSDESSSIKSQVLSQVKDKIVFMVDEGKGAGNIKHVTMELQPHNLGKVQIKMTFEDNKITVVIKAIDEETQNILFSNAKELAGILSKSTGSSSINVVVKNHELPYENEHINNQNNQQRYNDNYDQQNGHNRQRNNYYHEDKKEDKDDGIFSQLMNLKNIY